MAATKGLTKENVDKIVELYSSGTTLSAIGKIFGISGVSVRYRLKQRGAYDKDRNRWTEEEKERMIQAYNRGDMLLPGVGRLFNISAHHCSQMLRKWGVKRLGPQRALITNRNNVSESDIVKSYLGFRDIEVVAKIYNTSDTSIRTLLRRNGLCKAGLKHELNALLEDNKEYVHKRVEQGSGLITICRELGGINPTTLYNYAKKWGLKVEYPLVKKVKKILTENRELMFKDYYEGKMSLLQVAKKYDVSPSRMSIAASKWGWKLHWRAIDTSIERFVEECLKKSNIIFEKQFKLRKFKCDFYLPELNLILETNGDYWHANPKIYSELDFDQVQRKNLARDERKFKEAQEKGFNIVYIWESEIRDKPEEIRQEIFKLKTAPIFHNSCRDFFLERSC